MNFAPRCLWLDPNNRGLRHLFLSSHWHLSQKLPIYENLSTTSLPCLLSKFKNEILVKVNHTLVSDIYYIFTDDLISNWTYSLLENDVHHYFSINIKKMY